MIKATNPRWVVPTAAFALLCFISVPLEAGRVSVKDTGARGDGSSDDTAAIQSAIDQVAEAGGGRVILPAGTYRITESLRVPENLRVSGESTAATVLIAPNELEFDLIVIEDASAVTVENLTLKEEESNFRGSGAGIHITGQSNRILIENVAAFGFRSGFSLNRNDETTVSGITLRNCHSEGARTFGFDINNCHQVLLDDCKAFRNRLDGMKLRRQARNVTIRGGESSFNGASESGIGGSGVDAYAGGESFVIRNLLVEENNGSGIYAKTGALQYQGFGQIGPALISEVICRRNRSFGLDINRSGGDLLKEGDERMPPLPSHFVVVGGLFEENERAGIYIRARNVSILAPIVRRNKQTGIDLSSAWDVQVVGAQVSGNGTAEPGSFSGVHIGYDEVKGVARRVHLRDSIINGIDDPWQQDGDTPVDGTATHAHAVAVSADSDDILIDGNIFLNWIEEEKGPVLVEAPEEATVLVNYGTRPEARGAGSPGSTLIADGRTYVKTTPAPELDGWALQLTGLSLGEPPRDPEELVVGEMRFDTQQGRPVWWNGQSWVGADGR